VYVTLQFPSFDGGFCGVLSQKEKDMHVFTCSDWTQVSKSQTKSKHPMSPGLGWRFYCRVVEAGRGGTEVD